MTCKFSRGSLVLTMLVFGLLITSCSAQEPGYSNAHIVELSQEELSKGNSEQADALADGEVDSSEYEEAYWNLRRCLEGYGYTVTDAYLNPVTQLNYDFLIDGAGHDQYEVNRRVDDCEERYWLAVSRVYVLTQPHVMAEPLKQSLVECLSQKGTNVDTNFVNLGELVDFPQVEMGDAIDCINERIPLLYPELPAYSISF